MSTHIFYTVILSDLISCWLVLIEVVLAVERALALNFAIQSDCCAQGRYQASFLKALRVLSVNLALASGFAGMYRLGPGKSHVEKCDMRIRLIVARRLCICSFMSMCPFII